MPDITRNCQAVPGDDARDVANFILAQVGTDKPAAPIKVGDRVRVLRAKYADSYVGREGIVASTTATWSPDNVGVHRFVVEFADGRDAIHAAEVELVGTPEATNPREASLRRAVEFAEELGLNVYGRGLVEIARYLDGESA